MDISTRPSTLPDAEMRAAFLQSDAQYDGLFFTAVTTTGIYCRPSCSARKPKPQHIRFYASAGEARAAGYRSCKRCRPDDAGGSHPAWIEKLIAAATAEQRLPDAQIRLLGVDPARVRRYFRAEFGQTFQGWLRARRLQRTQQQLRLGATVVEAACGYASENGARAAMLQSARMSIDEARRKQLVVTSRLVTPLGPMLAGVTDEGVVLLEFVGERRHEQQLAEACRLLDTSALPGEHPLLDELETQLNQYFAGKRRSFDLPLVTPGTAFQQRVWNELLQIPCGDTASYQQIAERIGSAGAVRAVGTANGRNRIAILVPCHRVINANGNLGGYGGGLLRKKRLLEIERGANIERL
jgi:AraC family transcriptional regulator of adaptative response/methylated-DNA-[protein]-cysteine methyltransferase